MSLFKKLQNEDDTLNSINITPLTDCMMVLLIIFMITGTAMSQTGFNIELPTAAEKEKVNPSQITISVTQDGIYYINDRQIKEQNLVSFLKEKKSPDTSVIIDGDSRASYLKIITAIDAAKQAGLNQIGLSTKEESNQSP